MPANLSREYKRAESDFRQARDAKERLAHLREMLRTIPKHKGTEHLQADIKSRIKQLTEEIASPKKAAHYLHCAITMADGAQSAPPQFLHASTSILNTRSSLCAQIMAA